MPKYTVQFFKTNKSSPIDDYIDKSNISERKKIYRNLQYLQEYGLRKEVLNLKKLKGFDIWEVRILGKDNTRIFCSESRDTIYVLHIFKKKSGRTPKRHINVAQIRKALLEEKLTR